MNEINGLLFLTLLAGFYFTLEGLILCYRYFFHRGQFLSWLNNTYVKDDKLYHAKYDRHGAPVSWKLNMSHPKFRKHFKREK